VITLYIIGHAYIAARDNADVADPWAAVAVRRRLAQVI